MVGKGKKTVLMLHGWGDDSSTFRLLAQRLAHEYAVISIDLPGFGKSQAPAEVWGLGNYAHCVAEVIKKLKLNVSVLIGHSNGGAIAIIGLANGVLKADKLVLLASAGIRNQQQGRKHFIKLLTKSGKVATFWLPERHKSRLQKKLYSSVGSDMLIAPELQETFKKTVEQDIQREAKKITIPTLLIYGENDDATPTMYGEIYHQLIPNSTLEIVGGAGHFVHQDKEQEVNRLIQEFLA